VRRSGAAIAAIVLACLILGAGVIHLLRLRFARGDVYPPYSSLRADPLGAKILHDALVEIGAVSVGRHTVSWSRLEGGPETTVLILGLPPPEVADQSLLEFTQRLALRGSRVVIALAPEREPERRARDERKDGDAGAREPEGGGPVKSVPGEDAHPVRHWGFELDRIAPCGGDGGGREVADRWSGSGLPDAIPWRSAVVFADVQDPWRILYGMAGRPVMLERALGAGSLVVMSDSYVLSNEAMWRDRRTALIAWLLGPSRRVLFEETVHGIEERDNVAVLLRRYRLVAPGSALLVLAGLALWYAGTPLLPRRDTKAAEPGVVVGRDSAAGLVTLLRRGVPPPDLVRVCVEEWSRSGGDARAGNLERVRCLPLDPRDPVEDYRRIHHLVTPTEGDHDR
jgi:hypothetical protein